MSAGPLAIGEVVSGDLEVLREVGRGGFATVYAVRDRGGRELALKVMHERREGDDDEAARFQREAEVLGRLSSPSLPRVHGVSALPGGETTILMELLVGRTLAEAVEEGALAPRRVARLGAQIAEALAVAHEAGVLHRDLKPENLFLVAEGTEEERVKVLDFGVATFVAGKTDRFGSLTQTNAVVGTPHYMSPEQIRSAPLDGRSDLYMLGIVLYELLTGTRPFDGETFAILLASIHSGTPPPIARLAPATPDALIAIVEKAMRREREERFRSAREMAAALRAAEDAPAPDPATRRAAAEAKATIRARPGGAETMETIPRMTPVTPAPTAQPEMAPTARPVMTPTARTRAVEAPAGRRLWAWGLGAGLVGALGLGAAWWIARSPAPPPTPSAATPPAPAAPPAPSAPPPEPTEALPEVEPAGELPAGLAPPPEPPTEVATPPDRVRATDEREPARRARRPRPTPRREPEPAEEVEPAAPTPPTPTGPQSPIADPF
ncbi:MAG TPA: serine/threonine-protein kinase [Polyangiaceae bacterium LLY-WYZ-15_(1-7)]|nr:serine/threonine-protein kinase [Polyangiaceae bacterium LLY-WYZ-15_(1-7)]HJL07211.1 serine/threonine-protein kinase [Polyangiaceae bacterium LLY-WYZ-15_(1-7)]